ncbi:cell division protein FtsQ/DivIB [Streptomyces sp. C10-9-1]|uniref:cell division protein FtsQ/DivIB n=1 Tax=Streptomyces sp. C10-9-1 TaxID=1859285 RepID=UPI003D739FA1
MAGPTTAERGARQPRDGSGGSGGPAPAPGREGGARRGRRLRRALVAAVAAASVLAGLAWVLYGSPWLRTREVGTTGTRLLTPEEVERVADVPIGAPLASVDTGRTEARLLRELPRIRSVRAVRSWPHAIRLEVTERTAVLLLREGSQYVEVDAEGVQFATVPVAPRGIPLLEVDAARSPSRARFGEDRLLAAAVAVRSRIPEDVVGDLVAVKVRSYDDISLRLTGDRTVLWGSSEEGEAKARALTALLKAAPDAGRYDVTVPTAPASSGS